MKRIAAVSLLFISFGALADCKSSLTLSGTAYIEPCDPATEVCKPAGEALHEYSELSDDQPSVLTIGLHASPWRMYDPEMRILTVQDLAVSVRPMLTGEIKRVELIGSWTAVAPYTGGKSLAERLSEELAGFPVGGMDGFHWVAKDGSTRTTHQAFTIRKGVGTYSVRVGGDVMASLVAGWPTELEGHFVKDRDAYGIMRAGAGWDIYYLCPDRALASFELAATMSNAIAAYNAALIRLERGDEGDREAARALLSQASELGDKKAKEMLQGLKQSDTASDMRSK